MIHTTRPKRESGLAAFFGLTFAITWGLAALFVLLPSQMEAVFGKVSAAHPLFILAVAGPTIAATILTFRRDGLPGLAALYARMGQWRFGVRWYAAMLVGIPLVSYLLSRVTDTQLKYDFSTPASLIGFLLLNIILGPLGEELGWRGFALTRLLRRYSPFAAGLIVGAFWGVWHLPAFFLSGLPQASLGIPTFLFGALCLSILATWIFVHTGASVPSVALFHYIWNISADLFGVPQLPFMLATALAAVLVVVLDRQFGWFRRGGFQGASEPSVALPVAAGRSAGR